MDRYHLEQYLLLFKERKYAEAYNILLPAPQTQMKDMLLSFCLEKMDRYTDINIHNILDIIKNEKYSKEHIYFIRSILKSFDRTEDLKMLDFSLYDRYETAILNKEYDNAIKAGLEIYDQNKFLLLYALILSDENPERDELLENTYKEILEETDDANLLYHIVKRKVKLEVFEKTLLEIYFGEFIYFLILRDFIINYKDELCNYKLRNNKGILDIVKLKEKNENALEEFLKILLPLLDDWKLYELAIENNIDVQETKSLNYLYYKIIVYNDQESIKEIILKTESIEEIHKIKELTKITIENKPLNLYLDILDKIEQKEEYDEPLKSLYQFYISEPTVFNISLLLSALISTRDESYLLLSLYLLYKSNLNHPSLDIINLYLHKYFKLNPMKIVNKLELKNNQLLCFIDPSKLKNREYKFKKKYQPVLNIETKDFDKKLDNVFFDIVREVNTGMLFYARTGMIEHALSLVPKKKELYEIFDGKKKYDEHKDLLGPLCSYIFKEEYTFSNKIYKNKIADIDDKGFLVYLKNRRMNK